MVFLGGSEVRKLLVLILLLQVGKTSIIDQFMSSEHADVYVENIPCPKVEVLKMRCPHPPSSSCSYCSTSRTVTVDVNGKESRLSLIEAEEVSDLGPMKDLNPDCYVVVYAVDNEQSFGERRT